jgi:hypothetical protein
MDKLRLLVKPYFVPSFLYKIDKKVNKYYIVKETVVPAQSNKILFYLAPVIAILVSLLG